MLAMTCRSSVSIVDPQCLFIHRPWGIDYDEKPVSLSLPDRADYSNSASGMSGRKSCHGSSLVGFNVSSTSSKPWGLELKSEWMSPCSNTQ